MKYTDTQTPKVLAYALLGIIAITLAGLFWIAVPTGNKDIINAIIQTLLTLTVAGMAYYHGTSSGSAAKTSMLAKESESAVPPPAPEPKP